MGSETFTIIPPSQGPIPCKAAKPNTPYINVYWRTKLNNLVTNIKIPVAQKKFRPVRRTLTSVHWLPETSE